jgi:hypothetical protein
LIEVENREGVEHIYIPVQHLYPLFFGSWHHRRRA